MLAGGAEEASADLTSSYATQIVGRIAPVQDAGGDWHLVSRKSRPSLAGRAL